VCLRTLGAGIVVLIIISNMPSKQHNDDALVDHHASLQRSIQGFIDATVMIRRYDSTSNERDEAGLTTNTTDGGSDGDNYCDGRWYSSSDSVMTVLDFDVSEHHNNDMQHNDSSYYGGVLSMEKTIEGISVRHDLLRLTTTRTRQ